MSTTPVGAAPRVVAVVVTWNRRELLLESLAAVRARFADVELIPLRRNTGGAGGFAAGLDRALASGAELVWLMDDDTVPEPGALAALVQARGRAPGPPPALVASRVVWTDGREHPMNTPRRKPFATRAERAAAAAAGCVPVRSASFVSVLVDAAQCRRRGLPQADYFLWNDDFEYTTRLIRGGTGWLCPASVAVHKTRTFGSTDIDPGARFYYEVRNKIWMLRSGAPLGPVERVLYGGSTLRRWARTFARSSDRAVLRSSLVRGFAAGVRTSPRRPEEVLAAAGLTVPGRAAPGRAAPVPTAPVPTAPVPTGPGASPPAR